MSTPANTGPEEKKGIRKVLSRMKTVLRRSDGSKRLPISGRSAAATTTTTPSAAGPRYVFFPLLLYRYSHHPAQPKLLNPYQLLDRQKSKKPPKNQRLYPTDHNPSG